MSAVLPGASTYSKDHRFWGVDFQPSEIVAGFGAYVVGNDDKRYLDWVSSLGACITGHGHGVITERVYLQLLNGTAFSIAHKLERQVAEKLVAVLGSHMPGWPADDLQVRWTLGGSEACAGAVTLARAATKRRWVLSCGYHGWHAMFTGLTLPALGVIPDPCMANVLYGDIDALALSLQQHAPVAALIIEQSPQDPPEGYWQEIRRLCDDNGTLLIVDEVVTGFRYAIGGAAEFYNIRPDIAVYGKAIANGLPLGAIVAPREYMALFEPPSPVFVSATGAGNAVSLAAADAVLDLWNQAGVDHLWKIGAALMAGLRAAGYDIVGHPPRSLLQFLSNAERGFFIVGMRDRGILMNRPNLPNLAHTLADVGRTIEAAAEVKADMAKVDVAEVMRGREPCVLFEGR